MTHVPTTHAPSSTFEIKWYRCTSQKRRAMLLGHSASPGTARCCDYLLGPLSASASRTEVGGHLEQLDHLRPRAPQKGESPKARPLWESDASRHEAVESYPQQTTRTLAGGHAGGTCASLVSSTTKWTASRKEGKPAAGMGSVPSEAPFTKTCAQTPAGPRERRGREAAAGPRRGAPATRVAGAGRRLGGGGARG